MINYCNDYCRSGQWWNEIVLKTFNAQDWVENFRMSHDTFIYLCQRLSPALCRKDTAMRRPVTVEQRIAITLWCLATPSEYWTIAHLCGVAHSTVCEIIHEPCDAIVSTLLRTYITFSSGQQLDGVVEAFSTKWGVPQCVGAIDGCHVPIAAPLNNHTDYYNRKGFYSMVLQGVVDANYRVFDIWWGGLGASMTHVYLYIHPCIHK